MKFPAIQGIIHRRILANYRVAPEVLGHLLPASFRPKLVDGFGIAGICLIGLQDIRPRKTPSLLGLSSENAAHRIAVEWDDHGQPKEGVYIFRRDTNSWFNTMVGGRVFPGMHHHARFEVSEAKDAVRVAFESDDRRTWAKVAGHVTSKLPSSSVFPTLETASMFFAGGSLGYSVTRDPHRFDGLELHTHAWAVEPLEIEQIESSLFDDQTQFPSGSIEFDCALLMRDIPHEWQDKGQLCTL